MLMMGSYSCDRLLQECHLRPHLGVGIRSAFGLADPPHRMGSISELLEDGSAALDPVGPFDASFSEDDDMGFLERYVILDAADFDDDDDDL